MEMGISGERMMRLWEACCLMILISHSVYNAQAFASYAMRDYYFSAMPGIYVVQTPMQKG